MASQRLIWFTAPASRLPPSPAGTPCGFSLATPGPADANQRDHPLVRFSLLQGVALAPIALLLSERASCRFSAPLQRHETDRLHIQGHHPLVSLPSSAVSHRLRGHRLPVHPSRACFIPEALLRFSLQGVPFEQRPKHSSCPGSLLAVTTVATATPSHAPRTRERVWSGFKGLLSVRIRSQCGAPLEAPHGRSPPGFCPP